LTQVIGSKDYEEYIDQIKFLDEMVDSLSLARAKDNNVKQTSYWNHY